MIGLIARCDNTGLGNQTRELAELIKPDKILLINSKRFNGNDQFPEWYKKYNVLETNGFPKSAEIKNFLRGLDVAFSCETFYNNSFIDFAKERNVRTVLQYNYEFLDYLSNTSQPFPDMLISPSYWNLEEVTKQFKSKTNIIYLPPPTNHYLFNNSKEYNMSKDHNRILHIAGKAAAKDRNGTETVIEMMKYSKADFDLVIRTQTELNIKVKDSRIKLEYANIKDREDMYYGFDAMVLPRRYGGLCLPMNEALLSALPVFMTDIAPNNKVLPGKWLVQSNKIDRLRTRAMLDVFEADPKKLGQTVDKFISNKNKYQDKIEAFDIGMSNYSAENLKDKYIKLLK